ncbi:MAG: ATP-binding protein [Bacteroidia bacterium]|nr:ATP-binding protein [Bacteroidia bacterium]
MTVEYLPRSLEKQVEQYRQIFPVVALLGPRQCGKSTLAKKLIGGDPSFIHLDMERPSDVQKLADPELFFQVNQGRNICIDEIQLRPNLFPVLRTIVDDNRVNGRILLLGSASRDLLQQSSETLAGRIGYLELTPFMSSELIEVNRYDWQSHWLRGGFPDSYFQSDDAASSVWRENFIRTFVERDIPQISPAISPQNIRRFLTMMAHNQGQVFNSTTLGASLGLSHNTVRNYLDLIQQMFLLRMLPPLEANVKKRLIKSPKVYLRDSGLLHRLLEIEDMNALLGHPVLGFSWEGYVLEQILSQNPSWTSSFYRTSNGTEIDLILSKGNRRIAIEIKASTSPKVGPGFYHALEDLGISEGFIIAPVQDSYPVNKNVTVTNLRSFQLA